MQYSLQSSSTPYNSYHRSYFNHYETAGTHMQNYPSSCNSQIGSYYHAGGGSASYQPLAPNIRNPHATLPSNNGID
eukprot:gene21353-23429_t